MTNAAKKTLKHTQDNSFLDQILQHATTWQCDASKITANDKQLFVSALLYGNSLRDLQKRSVEEAQSTLQFLWDEFQVRPFAEIRIDLKEDSFGQDGRVDITILQRQMPFITDSVLNLLAQNDLSVNVMLNAAFKVRRDDMGRLLTMHHDDDQGPDLEADKILHLQCDHRGDVLDINSLRTQISNILKDVHAAVEDWRPMQGQISETVGDLMRFANTAQNQEAHQAAEFLTFMRDGNFTFLGYREHTVRHEKKATYYDILPEKSLGILRDSEFLLFDGLITDDLIPQDVSTFLFSPQPILSLLKANRRATVHRNVHMDVMLLKKYNEKGEVIALRLFAGLFTSQCYSKPTDQIPFLKNKIESVLKKSGHDQETHAWRSLKHVLDNYPRDELFQIGVDKLYQDASGINRLNSRPEIDVFIRHDVLQRYFSVLVYLPKEQYNTKMRLLVQSVLEKQLNGIVADHYITVDEKQLARLFFMIATETPILPEYNVESIRNELITLCEPWFDRLKKLTLTRFGKKESQRLLKSLTDSFSVSYQDLVSVEHAIDDLEHIQTVMRDKEMLITLTKRPEDEDGTYHVKLYKRDTEASLSEMLPILERLGFDANYEYAYEITPRDSLPSVWIHDIVGTISVINPENLAELELLFAETFLMAWHKKTENDEYNKLVLAAGLNWRQANLFRAYARYLDLMRYPMGKKYIAQVLMKYPDITRKLCQGFLDLHNPHLDPKVASAQSSALFAVAEKQLESVEKLDEDRVLRSMMNLMRETLRTNYYHTDEMGQPLDVLIFKFNANALIDLPKPKPFKEIFVFSPRVEAVHLRGGPIARGGIRWSDRFEDFRTEVLGLVKAQMVKNAVIVPLGAKGGFICKKIAQAKTPQERQQEGIACYQIMVRGLLSITDNMVNGKIVSPQNTVRLDGDDPYLVVAADKGTATFSDIANKISLDHGFWLGDAFASGGSKGYDHKAMGITARGAWECIKRHFRELGKDIQTTEFTVAGVGDMSGDVFGNGMLLSEHTLLVAAFDHRHIFIDPTPDAKKSFAERKRLFEKAGSSWMDYDPKLLSAGGAVFNRQDKSLTLTPQIQTLLDITNEKVTPNELIQAILRARVELMYFGGIGTYIKASAQTHEQVGDKGNDILRINANELRCQVIGEGANLAMTQLARIEFAQHGGRLNTDFIDNSAGVDTSDHEVNIKILLQPMVQNKTLSEQDRESLLVAMTNDVAQHVLKNNYDQSLALSLLQRHANDELSSHIQVMRHLEKDGLLDRRIEDLPDDDALQRMLQRREGLVRPQLAVLLAYSKMNLFNQLMASTLPDRPSVAYQAIEYFPDLLQQSYTPNIHEHQLKRDIIATEVANVIINRMGPTFIYNLKSTMGVTVEQIAKAWLITRAVFDLRTLWEDVDGLDNKVPADTQYKLYEQITQALQEGVKWFLHHHASDLAIDRLVPLYRDQLVLLHGTLNDILPSSLRARMQAQQISLDHFEAIRADVKKRLVQLPMLVSACDVIYLKESSQSKAEEIAKVNFALSERLQIATISHHLQTIEAADAWTQEAIDGLSDDVQRVLSHLTTEFLHSKLPLPSLEEWLFSDVRENAMTGVDTLMADMASGSDVDLSLLTVAVKRLQRLTHV